VDGDKEQRVLVVEFFKNSSIVCQILNWFPTVTLLRVEPALAVLFSTTIIDAN
jgi:hypothetical protein